MSYWDRLNEPWVIPFFAVAIIVVLIGVGIAIAWWRLDEKERAEASRGDAGGALSRRISASAVASGPGARRAPLDAGRVVVAPGDAAQAPLPPASLSSTETGAPRDLPTGSTSEGQLWSPSVGRPRTAPGRARAARHSRNN